MAVVITAASSNVNGACFLSNKNIVFSWSGWPAELSDLVALWNVEVTITNLTTLVDAVAATTVYTNQTEAQVELLTYTAAVVTPGYYRLTVRVFSTSPVDEEVATYDFSVCPIFDVIKNECYDYTLWRPSGLDEPDSGEEVLVVKITNGEETVELNYTWDTSQYERIHFKLPYDGVYTIELFSDHGVSGGELQLVYSFPIYEFCQFLFCFDKLNLLILCGAAIDPCCRDCKGEILENLKALRFTYNQLMALFGQLMGWVFRDKIKYLGIHCFNDCRVLEVKDISALFTRLRNIISTCGAPCGNINCTAEFLASCGCSPTSLLEGEQVEI